MNAQRAEFLLQENNCGTPIGYRIVKEDPDYSKPCTLGCMRGSDHFHPAQTGWLLIGTTGYVEADMNGAPYRVGMILPLSNLPEMESA